ncbi:hypothetical protein K435DRAFT_800164, partial [Dendrothele bispora CBS 962.96]
MSPRRNADAAHIAPYLTHEVSHLGQTTLIPPETAGRMRQVKKKKTRTNPTSNNPPQNTKGSGSSTRQAQLDEAVRFNTGPRNIRVSNPLASSSRTSDRRSRRQDRRENYEDDDIPDYPPPPFDEAIATPAIPVSPSTTTLVNPSSINPPLPLPPSPPLPAQIGSQTPGRNSPDSDSEGSLEIVERPPPVQTIERGRSRSRDLDLNADDEPPTPTSTHSKRRYLSLSPLRILPHKVAPMQDRALSANPSSPYRSSPFLKSTTSLKSASTGSFFRLPTSALSSTSLPKPDFVKGRFGKGKERSPEPLQSWEVVSGDELDDSPSLLSAIESIASPDSGSPSPTTSVFPFPPQPIDRSGNNTVMMATPPSTRHQNSPSVSHMTSVPSTVVHMHTSPVVGSPPLGTTLTRHQTSPPSVSHPCSVPTTASSMHTPPVISSPLPVTTVRSRLDTGRSSRSTSPALQSKPQGPVSIPNQVSSSHGISQRNHNNALVHDNCRDVQQIAADTPLPSTPKFPHIALAQNVPHSSDYSQDRGHSPSITDPDSRNDVHPFPGHISQRRPDHPNLNLPIQAGQTHAQTAVASLPRSARPGLAFPTVYGPHGSSASSLVSDSAGDDILPSVSRSHQRPTPTPLSISYVPSSQSGSTISPGSAVSSGTLTPKRTPTDSQSVKHYPGRPLPHPPTPPANSGPPILPSPLTPTVVTPSSGSKSIRGHSPVPESRLDSGSKSKSNTSKTSSSARTMSTATASRPRVMVDSMYGSSEREVPVSDEDSDVLSVRTAKSSVTTCPEVLLIDFGDSEESGGENGTRTWSGSRSKGLDFERLAALVARGATTMPPSSTIVSRNSPNPVPFRPSSPTRSHHSHFQRPHPAPIPPPQPISISNSTGSDGSDYYDADSPGANTSVYMEPDQQFANPNVVRDPRNTTDLARDTRAQQSQVPVGYHFGNRYESDCDDTFDATLSPSCLSPAPMPKTAETSSPSVEQIASKSELSNDDNAFDSHSIPADHLPSSPSSHATVVPLNSSPSQDDEQRSSTSTSSRSNGVNNNANVYSEFTDLDLLVSRLDDPNLRDGTNYD